MIMMQKLQPGATFPRDSDGSLAAYAWPGGYPIVWYASLDGRTTDADPLCAECATNAKDRGELVTGCDVYWEGPSEFCAHCGAEIPSAYGDPDKETP